MAIKSGNRRSYGRNLGGGGKSDWTQKPSAPCAPRTMGQMLAYEIHRNGKRLGVAGLNGDCVLSTIVTHVEGPGGGGWTFMSVG